ncbi:hypothetical protein [Peloplasma aerotolerans]|uniref:Uncharacterized protein n=1 Tax=Peloplasma aerotolerans TaxID=3044389 RepID=A0AAW6UBB1_9MOLU|nr:hypothetical protein [Mariniplasma sp. M4Ah]MDI6453687.1 hypothetical protein [Mariniplasma sp. M4Ah]
MASISTFIRLILLPNPFEEIEFGFLINLLIAEPLFHILAFSIVGKFYNRGDAPTLGSFMYLVAYWGLILLAQGILP